MEYPLEEKIGNPYLLVGREREFSNFGQWIANIPKKLSKSRVILARRKSGKTAFMQRLFNQLWSANGQVIPFYFNVPEGKMWYPQFAITYYRTFASHYISFLARDMRLVREPLTLDEIKRYGQAHGHNSLVRDVDFLHQQMERGHDLMWQMAYEAPHRFAATYDQRILVMIDEFQYLANHIHRREDCQDSPDETIPGSFHHVVESKVAPMLVTGSYISWLIEISAQYLEAGRLGRWYMSPALPPEEGLQAVYRYAEVYQQPVTNESARMLNQLCRSDPFFISCVVQSYYEGKQLDTLEGVVNTVNYELTTRTSEMSETWGEYIYKSLSRINDLHSKQILLYLSKYHEQSWTHREIKEKLQLDLSLTEVHQRLELLRQADLIADGGSDIRYQGLQDGVLYLVLRHRFEEEISTFAPDFGRDFRAEIAQLQQDKQRLQGQLNQLSGKVAEYQLATEFRTRKRFALSQYFKEVRGKTRLNITDVQLNVRLQRADGKLMELDIVAQAQEGRVIVVEVKKRQEKSSAVMVEDFLEKVETYRQQHPDKQVLPAFLSLGGLYGRGQSPMFTTWHCPSYAGGMVGFGGAAVK